MSSTHFVQPVLLGATALLVLQAVSVSWTPQAIAGSGVKYSPPSRPTPERTDGTGVRSSPALSCRQDPSMMFLAAMAPTTHTGETVTGRPTLYAYFTGSQPLEFRLTEAGKTKPLITQVIQADRPGFIPIAYPEEQPELTIGKDYRWSVEVVCNPKRRYENVGRLEVPLRRVAPTQSLKTSLTQAKTVFDRASAYAAAGVWYDAVDQLASGTIEQPKNTALKTELLDLLEQGGLKKTVEQERKTMQSSSCTAPSVGLIPRDLSTVSTPPPSRIEALLQTAGYRTSGAGASQKMRCP